MSNTQKIQDLMEDLTRGKTTAQYVVGINPKTKRLEIKPSDQVTDKDALNLGIEDMKVSWRECFHHR